MTGILLLATAHAEPAAIIECQLHFPVDGHTDVAIDAAVPLGSTPGCLGTHVSLLEYPSEELLLEQPLSATGVTRFGPEGGLRASTTYQLRDGDGSIVGTFTTGIERAASLAAAPVELEVTADAVSECNTPGTASLTAWATPDPTQLSSLRLWDLESGDELEAALVDEDGIANILLEDAIDAGSDQECFYAEQLDATGETVASGEVCHDTIVVACEEFFCGTADYHNSLIGGCSAVGTGFVGWTWALALGAVAARRRMD